jgi:hypothetical protein
MGHTSSARIVHTLGDSLSSRAGTAGSQLDKRQQVARVDSMITAVQHLLMIKGHYANDVCFETNRV